MLKGKTQKLGTNHESPKPSLGKKKIKNSSQTNLVRRRPRCRPVAADRSAQRASEKPQGMPQLLSTVIHKYDNVCCVTFGLGLGATREHTRHGSVTEEQQRPKPKAAQPSGRQGFSSQTSWLAPYRPLAGYAWCPCGSTSRLVWLKNPLPQTLSYLWITVLS